MYVACAAYLLVIATTTLLMEELPYALTADGSGKANLLLTTGHQDKFEAAACAPKDVASFGRRLLNIGNPQTMDGQHRIPSPYANGTAKCLLI